MLLYSNLFDSCFVKNSTQNGDVIPVVNSTLLNNFFKQTISIYYKKNLESVGLEFLPEPNGFFSNRWLSTATFSKKLLQKKNITALDFILKLAEYNIEARPIWKPMHTQPIFAKNEYFSVHKKSVAEDIFERGLCFPSCTDMSLPTQKKVCEIIKALLA